jgi:hypothetical protein
MKKHLLTAAAVLMSMYSYGQTKGTNTVNLGFSSITSEFKGTSYSPFKDKNSQLRIGYGLFVSDNNKVGVDLLYNRSKSESTGSENSRDTKGYGLGVNYQHYFPIVKTFYAYAGAAGEYSQSKGKMNSTSEAYQDTNGYFGSLTANGGLTWFISKRWALETNLISVGAYYAKSEELQTITNDRFSNITKSFNISSAQTFNNLAFKVYLMF